MLGARLLKAYLSGLLGGALWAVLPLAAALGLSLMTSTVLFGPAELGQFAEGETEEQHARLKDLYAQAEADSVRRGWEESRRRAGEAGDPFPDLPPGPGSEEWRYRAPWELFAALDRLSDAPPGESRALGLAERLAPEYRWGRVQETWSVTCMDGKGNTTHDSWAEERVLLTHAVAWYGTTEVVWEHRTDRWESGGCSHTHTYPVLSHRVPAVTLDPLRLAMGGLEPQGPDTPEQVVEIMDLYSPGWAALLDETDYAPAPARTGEIIRSLYQAHASELAGPAPHLSLPKGRVTSPFGPREHPILGGMAMHTGIDFARRLREPVEAAGSGLVLYTGWMGGYGQVVVVGHGGGVVSLYAHLDAVEVRPETWVREGDVIGRAGSTGMSTGPHLHFEVRVDGEPRDPMDFAR